MLPETLLCLLNAAIVLAQSRQQLSLNAVSSFNPLTLPNPPSFTLPTSNKLTVSIALCSSNSGGSTPRFFVTNSSTVDNPGSGGGTDVFEIAVNGGHGNWTGVFGSGGILAVENVGQMSFEVGVSDNGPIHEVLRALPLLGDTTANQALLFSPPFSPSSQSQPVYPNYTLPAANLSAPTPPSSSPNFTVILSPTSSSSPLTAMPQTGCFLTTQQSSGSNDNQSLWLRDEQGWRTQWIVGALTPLTNYTAYVIQDGTKVSGPIFFRTKSASFSCPLVSSLPYCPNVAYSVPLPAPASPFTTYDASTIPASISTPLLSSLTNFTTTLTTFACGRDWYSPLMTCADCQREYRKWLCTVSFTRCGEASPGDTNSIVSSAAPPSATGLSAVQPTDDTGEAAQGILSALVPQQTSSPSRNPNFPTLNNGYTMLLPCLETCTVVDRACPSFLRFRCPVRRFNAAASYGVGYVDSGTEEGGQGLGVAGSVQDRWGNIWCNG